jgi:hypothetical protein
LGQRFELPYRTVAFRAVRDGGAGNRIAAAE